jgi:transcriptional regulator with XRE-family HTH domain
MNYRELRAWRDTRHLSQNDLAKALNVSSKTVLRWETGRSPLPRDLEVRLAALVFDAPHAVPQRLTMPHQEMVDNYSYQMALGKTVEAIEVRRIQLGYGRLPTPVKERLLAFTPDELEALRPAAEREVQIAMGVAVERSNADPEVQRRREIAAKAAEEQAANWDNLEDG